MDEIILPVTAGGARIHHHNFKRFQRVADALQLRLYIFRRRDIAIREMPKIELHARLKAPLKRHFINAPGRLPARNRPFIHAAEKVIGRIKMRPAVRRDAHHFPRRELAFGQLIHANVEFLRQARRGHVMIVILNFGQHMRWVRSDPAFECHRNINETACHGGPLILQKSRQRGSNRQSRDRPSPAGRKW